jgi:hypothetical protein
MPSIERKSLDRIKPGDNLVVDAGKFARAGQPIDEKTIKLFARHRVMFVPTIALTYEEQEEVDEDNKKEFLLNEINKLEKRFQNIRLRMLDKVSSIYVPFSEQDRVFQQKGKKKQITSNKLLEPDPGPLYQPDIDAGSLAIVNQNSVRYLHEMLTSIYTSLDKLTRRDSDTRGNKNRIPRQLYYSIRLHSYYDGKQLSTVGNAVPWHVVDSALYFLITMININKKRSVRGYPLSEARFDPDAKTTDATVYQYKKEYIVEAALGILLHGIGFSQKTVHELVSSKPLLDGDDKVTRGKIRTLQRSINVARNLLRNRSDISSISRMMVSMQKEYPDGTGFPPLNENRLIHEFVRLMQIITTFDELTNPVLSKVTYSRTDVIKHLLDNSGPYEYTRDKFVKQKRFDKQLLMEFLDILAPYEIGEKVYLFMEGSSDIPRFVGRVFSYLDSYIPLISILHDERNGKRYRYGELLFYIPQSLALVMQGGKVKKKQKIEWVGSLKLHDVSVNPGTIEEYRDVVFGKERALAKRLRSA